MLVYNGMLECLYVSIKAIRKRIELSKLKYLPESIKF